MLEDRLVEVDAAEALDALRLAEDLEPVSRAAYERCVERAAAEVVTPITVPASMRLFIA